MGIHCVGLTGLEPDVYTRAVLKLKRDGCTYLCLLGAGVIHIATNTLSGRDCYHWLWVGLGSPSSPF